MTSICDCAPKQVWPQYKKTLLPLIAKNINIILILSCADNAALDWLCFAPCLGPATNKSRGCDAPYKRAEKTGNQRKAINTIFKVRLPLSEGSILLQRTSFSRDRVHLSTEYESPPSNSPPYHWTGMEEHAQDSDLHCGEQEGWSFDLQVGREDPSGKAVDGEFVQAAYPDSQRVASVLSSLANNEGSNDGSEEGQNWTINRVFWLDEPPLMQSESNGGGRSPPCSCSGRVSDDGWSSILEHRGGLSVGMSNCQNPEKTTSQALCDCQQYRYTTLGGAVVQQATAYSANNINAALQFWGPHAAMGGTAYEPQPVNSNHQWQSVMTFMPFGPYQTASQGYTMPATARCQTWGSGQEMTPDHASQIGHDPSTAQHLYHSHHAVMWI